MPTRARNDSAFGHQLFAIRDHARLTQKQLARQSGVSLSGLQKLEQGLYRNPRLTTMRRLAKGLHVPIADLLAFEDEDSNVVFENSNGL
ncbi:hypothetical protein AYO40_02330 [Planctomycetaceae bacterium SCGC AG-212-D15]|nr:hypothetical protein AYO40_02330 [Planctomycetaceae bacterium SCGC AG-212-D15]